MVSLDKNHFGFLSKSFLFEHSRKNNRTKNRTKQKELNITIYYQKKDILLKNYENSKNFKIIHN